jgi:hypothetical protein
MNESVKDVLIEEEDYILKLENYNDEKYILKKYFKNEIGEISEVSFVTDEEILKQKKENLRLGNLKAKQKINEYILCNNFNYFFTLTLDKDKVNSRYDMCYLSAKIRNSFKYLKKKYPDLIYIIIAEHHKKDGAIHFHGLTNIIPYEEVNNNGYLHSKYFFNSYGFNSFLELYGDKAQLANYITKYINKDMIRFDGGYRYISSRGLKTKTTLKIDIKGKNLLPLYVYLQNEHIEPFVSSTKYNTVSIFEIKRENLEKVIDFLKNTL